MTALPAELSAALDALAALPCCPRGSVTALAREYDRAPGGLRVLIHNRRRNKRRPDGVVRSPLTFLTDAERDDYFVYRRSGYRRAEALAALGIPQ